MLNLGKLGRLGNLADHDRRMLWREIREYLFPRDDGTPRAVELRSLAPVTREALYTWCDGGGDSYQQRARRAMVDWVMLEANGPDDEVARLALDSGDTDHEWLRELLSGLEDGTPEQLELRWRVFRDESAPVRLRIAAARGAHVLERPEGSTLLDSLLERAVQEDAPAVGALLHESSRGNEYLLHVMNDGVLAGETLRRLVEEGYWPDTARPGSGEATLAVLDRYLETPGEKLDAVARALAYLSDSMVVYEHPGYLLTAARDPRYVRAAIGAMADRRTPEFREALCGMLENDWPALTPENEYDIRTYAVAVLVSYGGRETIEFRSGKLFEVGVELRETMVAALEELRQVEELRASWRTVPLPDRDEALIELVEMLESGKPQVRAAAARGLAAFGAIEAIPRLIRLLEDDSELVRTAAEKALERLYELPVEAKGESGELEEDAATEGDDVRRQTLSFGLPVARGDARQEVRKKSV